MAGIANRNSSLLTSLVETLGIFRLKRGFYKSEGPRGK